MHRRVIAHNQTQGVALMQHGEATGNAWERGKGLIRHAPLRVGEGLMIAPCSSVHTFWMGFPIDVVYVDQQHRVVRLAPDLVPNRIGPIVRQAAYVLELPVGTIQRTGTQVGDVLKIKTEGQEE